MRKHADDEANLSYLRYYCRLWRDSPEWWMAALPRGSVVRQTGAIRPLTFVPWRRAQTAGGSEGSGTAAVHLEDRSNGC